VNKTIRNTSLAVAAILALGACGSSGGSATASTAKTPTSPANSPASAAPATQAPATTGPSAATTATPASTQTTPTTTKSTPTTQKPTSTTVKPTATTKPTTVTTTSGGSATVDLGKTTLGTVLVDAQGHTLYLNKKDVQGKSSSCDATCVSTWPPLEATAAPTAGAGVDKTKLATITRADGKKQVTYNGWPLYRHIGDTKAGNITGEKVASQWYAIDAKGAAV